MGPAVRVNAGVRGGSTRVASCNARALYLNRLVHRGGVGQAEPGVAVAGPGGAGPKQIPQAPAAPAAPGPLTTIPPSSGPAAAPVLATPRLQATA